MSVRINADNHMTSVLKKAHSLEEINNPHHETFGRHLDNPL